MPPRPKPRVRVQCANPECPHGEDGQPAWFPKRESRLSPTGKDYCTQQCRDARPSATVLLVCSRFECGKTYPVERRKAETSRFCSRDCTNLAARTRDRVPCPVCGKEAVPGNTYCSPEHYREDTAGKPRRVRSDAGQERTPRWVGSCSGPDCCNLVRRPLTNVKDGVAYCSRGCFLRTRKNAPSAGRPNTEVGTRRPAGEGYVRVKTARGSRGWRLEHIVKMEEILGRPLWFGEEVHHINGVKDDNRVDGPLVNFRSGNLELWATSQPKGQRVEDIVEWAKEMLRRYDPDALA